MAIGKGASFQRDETRGARGQALEWEVIGFDGQAVTEKQFAEGLKVQFTPTLLLLGAEGRGLDAATVTLAVACFGLGGCLQTPEEAESRRPNILVLIADDQRWDQLSCAEQPLIPELSTPNLDRLAAQGALFRNAFVTTPICAVSSPPTRSTSSTPTRCRTTTAA